MDTTFHFTPSSTHLTTSQIEALLNNSIIWRFGNYSYIKKKKKKKRKKEKRKKEKEIWKLLLQTFGAVEPWQLGFTSPHENPFKYYKGHISSLKATPLIKWLKPFIIALQTLTPHNHPQTPLKFEPPGSVFSQNLQTTILFYKAPPLVCKTMKPFL